MESTDRSTPLHGWHVAQGAHMGLFGGYRMPLWYGSARAEHLAVLTGVGLFDTSHIDLGDVGNFCVDLDLGDVGNFCNLLNCSN